MTGIGLSHRGRVDGQQIADEQPDALVSSQPPGFQTQFGGEGLVENQQLRICNLGGPPRQRQLREFARETVAEADGLWVGDSHIIEGTWPVTAASSCVGCREAPRRRQVTGAGSNRSDSPPTTSRNRGCSPRR